MRPGGFDSRFSVALIFVVAAELHLRTFVAALRCAIEDRVV